MRRFIWMRFNSIVIFAIFIHTNLNKKCRNYSELDFIAVTILLQVFDDFMDFWEKKEHFFFSAIYRANN